MKMLVSALGCLVKLPNNKFYSVKKLIFQVPQKNKIKMVNSKISVFISIADWELKVY